MKLNLNKKRRLGLVFFVLLAVGLFSWAKIFVRKPGIKNVIIMIIDGAGFNHIRAASLYQYGRDRSQIYDYFPVRLGMTTFNYGGNYSSDSVWKDFHAVQIGASESASSATAIATGVKTSSGAVGVDVNGVPLKNLVERAESRGKMTGVVTTVEFSHATPASFIAHNISRNNYEALAQEMLLDSPVDVVMGCGNPWFDDNGVMRKNPNTYAYVGGGKVWDQIIAGTAGSDADGDGINDPWQLVQTRESFQSLARGLTPKRVLGVPQVFQTLQQAREGDRFSEPFSEPLLKTVPTLAEMSLAALNILDEDPDGFMLMIEGGAVDWASHANQKGRMIEEMIDFNKAVEAVTAWIRERGLWDETLLIITADHETGYLTGPGSNPEWKPLENKGQDNIPGMEWHSGSHTNSLVPFFAKGAQAKKFLSEIRGEDPRYGAYSDHTAIIQVIGW